MADLPGRYDIIIAGAGLAGLSLACRISRSKLSGLSILVVDKENKTLNDRTWCFWETGEGFFEPVVFRKWNHIAFFGEGAPEELSISPFSYKMIRGIDFYRYALEMLKANPMVHFLKGDVEGYRDEKDGAVAMVNGVEYRALWVFNSSLRPASDPAYNTLLQHFKGYIIRTKSKAFNPDLPVFMDFRVEQQGDVRFGYVLPHSETEGLAEFTLFSASLLGEVEYRERLEAYIKDRLQLQSYEIIEEEFGVIPMSDQPFPAATGKHIIHIGTAGGQTKASTGYTFYFVQKHTAAIVDALAKGKMPVIRKGFLARRFVLYDSTLLDILRHRKYPGHQIFGIMFARNPAPRVLRFLSEGSTIGDEILLFSRLPLWIFLTSFLKMAYGRTVARIGRRH